MQVSPFCEFMNFNMGDFFMHVTAVYNSSHLESGYSDSINFGGIAVGLDNSLNCRMLAIQSISLNSAVIRIDFNQMIDSGEISIWDLMGTKIGQYTLVNQKFVVLTGERFLNSICIVNVRTNKESFTRKLILR